jgi:hypothetical protein
VAVRMAIGVSGRLAVVDTNLRHECLHLRPPAGRANLPGSSLAQLQLMFVIVLGQQVIGKAAESRPCACSACSASTCTRLRSCSS